jgi:methyl-accepting chemotaxis protein
MSAAKDKGFTELQRNLTNNNGEKRQKEILFQNETTSFIQGMSALLAETVKQHHIVNSEHYILGELADNVKTHMNEI